MIRAGYHTDNVRYNESDKAYGSAYRYTYTYEHRNGYKYFKLNTPYVNTYTSGVILSDSKCIQFRRTSQQCNSAYNEYGKQHDHVFIVAAR